MPQKQTFRLNKNVLRNVCQSLVKNAGNIAFGGLMCSIVGGFGWIVVDTATGIKQSRAEDKVQEITLHHTGEIRNDVDESLTLKTEFDEIFVLNGPNQVTLRQGPNLYALDFNTQIIAFDGPDDSDTTFSFESFPDEAFTDRALDAGRQIATAFNASLDQRLDEDEREWLTTDHEDTVRVQAMIDEGRAMSAAFLKNYGPQG